MSEKKKETGKTETEAAASRPVEQMILDRMEGKYNLVPLAAVWAKELRRQEEFRHLSQAQILEAALRDVLSGKIGWEQVNALPKPEPAAEAKPSKK